MLLLYFYWCLRYPEILDFKIIQLVIITFMLILFCLKFFFIFGYSKFIKIASYLYFKKISCFTFASAIWCNVVLGEEEFKLHLFPHISLIQYIIKGYYFTPLHCSVSVAINHKSSDHIVESKLHFLVFYSCRLSFPPALHCFNHCNFILSSSNLTALFVSREVYIWTIFLSICIFIASLSFFTKDD